MRFHVSLRRQQRAFLKVMSDISPDGARLCHSRERGNPSWKPMNMYYIYIMASKRNGTLYVGVTNNLLKRVYEHKNDLVEGFTKRYGIHRLVYYEQVADINSAIQREKRLKKWRRQWKIELIEQMNPDWKDLYDQLVG